MKRKMATRFDQLSDAEREAVFQSCEKIGPLDGQPLNAADRRRHAAAGLPLGRPKIGRGVKRINISMEKGLLSTADQFARKHGMTRARLIAESVVAFMAGAA
jgi:hypothetical protein